MRAVAKKKKRGAGGRPSPAEQVVAAKTRAEQAVAKTRAEKAVKTRDAPGLLAAILLALGFAGAALVFDSQADASFDAPKRLVSLVAIAAAALATFGFGSEPWGNPFAGGRLAGWRDRRIPFAIFLFAAAATAV
jgi:hypothetical protein